MVRYYSSYLHLIFGYFAMLLFCCYIVIPLSACNVHGLCVRILAAFKIVKNLLPEKAIEILRVISKKNINEYVERSCCLRSWGGTDNYEFQFVPEKRKATVGENATTEHSKSSADQGDHSPKKVFIP